MLLMVNASFPVLEIVIIRCAVIPDTTVPKDKSPLITGILVDTEPEEPDPEAVNVFVPLPASELTVTVPL